MIDSRNRSVGRIPVTRQTPSARRRGQALLMAVLLMIFAALLGSTFITVVALNLNHAGRQQDMSSAEKATQAGFLVANQNLTTSVAGENWRPEMVSPPTAPDDPNLGAYSQYYTPLERAQGWARDVGQVNSGDTIAGVVSNGDWDGDGTPNTIADDWVKLNYAKEHDGKRVFVKFPDPRSQPASTSTPTYLVEVKYLPTLTDVALNPKTLALDTTENPDKYGKIRITVIGEANDNTNVFTRRVSYKSTSISGGPMAYAYFVSNWDNNNNRLISTKLATQATSGFSTITVQNASGITRGRMLIIHDTNNPTDTVVTVQSVSGTTVTLDRSYTIAAPFAVGSLVQAASPIMQNLLDKAEGGSLFNATGNDAPANAYDSTSMVGKDPFEANVPYSSAPSNGFFINATTIIRQKSQFNLNSAFGTKLQATGLINIDNPVTQLAVDGGTAAPVTSSSAVSYNSNPQSTEPGANPVRTITPPKLDGQRYLQLTKYSDVANDSAYGYGSGSTPTGVYIDNANDFEKVAAGAGYRALSIFETQRLWQRKSFVANTGIGIPNPDLTPNVPAGLSAGNTVSASPRYRLAFANHAIVAPAVQDNYTYPKPTGSLEEQGIRGWVSPYEFKPRGVLIELDPVNNNIIITRDQLTDGPTPNVPNPAQEWKDPATGAALAYQMVIHIDPANPANETRIVGTKTYTVPFNGVIYAEGDVRIRGTLGNPSRSLTVVSMGNIYVDGDLEQGQSLVATKPTYIALLAKKNVALNPTQFFVQSVDPAVAIPGATSAPLVAGDDPAVFPAATPQTPERFFNLSSQTQKLARNIHFNVAPVNALNDDLYLAVQHSAEHREAFTLTYNDPSPGGTGSPFNVAIKDPTAPDTVVDSTEKKFIATLASASGTDPFPFHAFNKDLLAFGGFVRGDDTTGTIEKLQNEPEFLNAPGPPVVLSPWTITTPDAATTNKIKDLPVRRIAQFNPSTGLTWNSGDVKPVMLTSSIGAYWNPGKSTATNLDFTLPPKSSNPTTGTDRGFIIGSSFKYVTQPTPGPTPVYSDNNRQYFEDMGGVQANPTPAATAPTPSPYQSTVNERFYWNRANPTQPQALMRWGSYRLDDGNTAPAVVGDNLIVFSRDQNEPNDGLLPAYRVGGFKLERGAGGKAPWGQGNFAINTVDGTPPAQAIVVQVQATIFAQEGSWFVIPQPLSPAVDVTGAGTSPPTDAVSLAIATRYRRPNYQVYIKGNIAQNYAPTADIDIDVAQDAGGKIEQDPDGHIGGAMAAWIDSMAYPTTITAAAEGSDWRSIAYLAFPIPTGSGLYMPVSPDVDLTG